MFLDLNKIGPEGSELESPLSVPDLEAGGENVAVLEARLQAQVSRGKLGFEFSGHLAVRVRLSCGRCLEPFVAGLTPDFFLILVSKGEDTEPRTAEDEEEAASFFLCPAGKADLVDMVSEQIYLNLPLKPVCRSDCKGLCPSCGVNRNTTACGCRTESIDPRLAPLLDFKARQER